MKQRNTLYVEHHSYRENNALQYTDWGLAFGWYAHHGLKWPVIVKDELVSFKSEDKNLTLKHRETHGCVVSTVATDAPVLKHQAISILSTD